jgi:hypothetical protein
MSVGDEDFIGCPRLQLSTVVAILTTQLGLNNAGPIAQGTFTDCSEPIEWPTCLKGLNSVHAFVFLGQSVTVCGVSVLTASSAGTWFRLLNVLNPKTGP